MQSYIKEVGRGKKGAVDLSYEDAYSAANQIFDGKASDAQIAAFFMAVRMKGEAVDELQGCVDSLRQHLEGQRPSEQTDVLDVAGPYDGRGKSIAATVPASLVVASAGQPVYLHSVATLPPKYGVSLLDVASALKLPVVRSITAGETHLANLRIALGHTESLCPSLAMLRQIRLDLGVRTLLNTAEKFINPMAARYSVSGVFHTSALEKGVELVQRLGYAKALVVQGIDGSEDLPTNRPSQMYRVDGENVTKWLVNPADYRLKTEVVRVPETAEEHGRWTESVLQGADHPARPMVILNAAVRLWLTGKVESIEQGVGMAASLVDNGSAFKLLQLNQAASVQRQQAAE